MGGEISCSILQWCSEWCTWLCPASTPLHLTEEYLSFLSCLFFPSQLSSFCWLPALFTTASCPGANKRNSAVLSSARKLWKWFEIKCEVRTEFQGRHIFSSSSISKFEVLLHLQCCAAWPHPCLALELKCVPCSPGAHLAVLCFVCSGTRVHGPQRVCFSGRGHQHTSLWRGRQCEGINTLPS